MSTITFPELVRQTPERAHGPRKTARRGPHSIASPRGDAAAAPRQRATLSARWSVDTGGRLRRRWVIALPR